MPIDKLIVTITSLLGLVFTYWFFLMKKERPVGVTDSVNIRVDGGYTPDVISLEIGKPVRLNFLRSDENSCLEEVVLSDFKIRKFLPLNKEVTIQINPQKAGEYVFTCGMNMFHGKIIVEDPEIDRRIK